MENESLGMAMAKLAKLAKPIPPKKSFPGNGYGESGETGEKAQSPGHEKPGFRQNSQNSRSHSVEINFSAGPHVTIEQLPARLVSAAIRACREIHQDTEEAVQEMLADLTWNDPADWDVLIDHFEQQLPPPPPMVMAMVTCSGCRHAAPSPHHPGIVHCKAGVESGAATAGWFDTDRHPCDKWEVRS